MKAVLFSSNVGDIPAELAFKNNLAASAAPTVNDDSSAGYEAGSQWVYAGTSYTCVDATAGAAVWLPTTQGDVDRGQITAPDASTPTGAGGAASLTGGAGGTTSGNGGKSGAYGGAATAGNSNGGMAELVGGAKHGTGRQGAARLSGYVLLTTQAAPAALTAGATMTAAQVLAGLITGNLGTGAGGNYQMPDAADLDTALPEAVADDSFDFSVINISTVAAEDITVTTNSGWTLVGGMVVNSNDAGTSVSVGRFRARKTGAAAWTLYRIG